MFVKGLSLQTYWLDGVATGRDVVHLLAQKQARTFVEKRFLLIQDFIMHFLILVSLIMFSRYTSSTSCKYFNTIFA